MNKRFYLTLFACFSLLIPFLEGRDFESMYREANLGENDLDSYIISVSRIKSGKNSNSSDQILERETEIKELLLEYLRTFPGVISLYKDDGGGKIFGLYYNTELHGRFPPFYRVFGGGNSKIGGILKKRSAVLGSDITSVHQFRSSILNRLQLRVLDLNDAYVVVEDMVTICELKSLKYLAMSSRGMKYDKPFSFPPNIQTLIVRNSELTPHFFKSLESIKGLDHLVIDRCNIQGSYEWPTVLDRNHLLTPAPNGLDSNNPFKNIAGTLKVLTIKQSDPLLVEKFSCLAWPKLASIEVDVFWDSEFLRINLSKSDEEFRKSFPILEKVTLSLFDSNLSKELRSVVAKKQIKELEVLMKEIPRR